ncbi:MAG: asparagine synthase (glutamine-hydrolyzing) [Prochlorococcus marinus XMU1425]|nr:asparagine synthase (glutamine-hydrolyzing) [Prochlorococcus marinus XMU1425]MCR8534177.1 asparagine synthase (glutamine-hydrolyzing) [Prochlorococcus marinus XMU1426]
MCGIVGFYLKKNSPQIKKEDFLKAIDSIEHRGPDNKGLYFQEQINLGLGHTRLSIQDISSSANQPMISHDKRFTIVFNGEIYNFKELKEKFNHLNKNNYKWKTNSDTEVILNLFSYFIEFGLSIKEFLSLLNGIFAFAIWDAKTEELFLARDALGVKPLYYASNKNGFIFSSEIKSFPYLGISLDETNFQALDRYLTYIWCPGEETPSKNIKKLLPGHAFFVKNGEKSKTLTWYKLPYLNNLKKIKKKKDCIYLTRKYLKEAVRRQLISNVPIGAFLSGGLDSSSIVNFAREYKTDIDCFTIKTKDNLDIDGFVDDYPYALKVSKHLNVPLHVVEVDDNSLINGIEEMIFQLDEPIADPACINVLLISQLARKLGIKVLLSGTGGDDIFSGYRRHLGIGLESYWDYLPFTIRKFLKNKTQKFSTGNPTLRRVKEAFSGADLNPDERLLNYFRWISRSNLYALYSEKFLKSLSKDSDTLPMISYLSSVSSDLSRLERMLLIEQRFYLPDHNLMYTDKMSMKTGVEVRVPFLDLDLVKLSSQIPAKYKQNGLQGKWVLKKAMEPYLPKDIIYRPKTGFGLPIRKWIKNELKEWISYNLSHEKIIKRGLFNPIMVKKLIEDNQNNKIDAGWTLLSLACIEIWFSKFRDDYYL